MTLDDLLMAEAPLTRLTELPLPAALSYRLAILARAVRAHLDPFQTTRNALIEKYGETRPTTPEEQARGQGPEVKAVRPDAIVDFLRELRELVAVEVTVSEPPLDLAQLPATVTISAQDIRALGPLVTWNGAGPVVPNPPPFAPI